MNVSSISFHALVFFTQLYGKWFDFVHGENLGNPLYHTTFYAHTYARKINKDLVHSFIHEKVLSWFAFESR